LILFDARGANRHSENFWAAFGFDAVFHQPGELREFLRAHLRGPFRALYQPVVLPPKILGERAPGLGDHFAAVCQLVIATGRVIFAVDEVDRFTTPGSMPCGLEFLVNQGRHVSVSLACTSRRPAQVARELTSQAHLFYIFRTTEPRDLSYLEEYVGREAAARLPHLGEYECLEWEETGGTRVTGGQKI
jgi:hypothetical protein